MEIKEPIKNTNISQGTEVKTFIKTNVYGIEVKREIEKVIKNGSGN